MSTNDVTGDRMVSKPVTAAFAEGHELIWGKHKTRPTECAEQLELFPVTADASDSVGSLQ